MKYHVSNSNFEVLFHQRNNLIGRLIEQKRDTPIGNLRGFIFMTSLIHLDGDVRKRLK